MDGTKRLTNLMYYKSSVGYLFCYQQSGLKGRGSWQCTSRNVICYTQVTLIKQPLGSIRKGTFCENYMMSLLLK